MLYIIISEDSPTAAPILRLPLGEEIEPKKLTEIITILQKKPRADKGKPKPRTAPAAATPGEAL